MTTSFVRCSLWAALAFAAAGALQAADLSVAAAANLVYALKALDTEFERAHPGVKVQETTGASGNLVTQIAQGAPYEVFLSADLDFAQKLIKAGGASPDSLETFAVGRLVLWTTRPDLAIDSIPHVVSDASVRRLAIANPKTAPYGRAAAQALAKLGLTGAAQPKLVQGENISQTAEFVSTGNADAGFVALSLVLSPQLKTKGRWIEVPADLYAPLGQAAVITKAGAANPAARDYLVFLSSPEAGRILERFGYRLP